MLCRNSYLQCELPLPSSQATLQHPGSSTNCPHSVVAYAQRDVPMHSRPKLHAPATQVPRQDPASTTCPRARRPALRLVRSSTILPAAPACRPKLHVPAPIPQQDVPAPPLARSLVVLLRSIPYSQRELPCVSSAAPAPVPRQESPPLPLTRSLVLFHALPLPVVRLHIPSSTLQRPALRFVL